jgi:hypothetical protein
MVADLADSEEAVSEGAVPVANGNYHNMLFRATILIGYFIFTSLPLFAQEENRFVYFQSDPPQSFSVLLDRGFHHSSSVGYLTLSGLPATEWSFTIRIGATEVRYQVDLSKGDKGLSIRQQEGKWNIWDLRAERWLVAIEPAADTIVIDTMKASPFARMLSKAAQDPSLLSNQKKGTLASKIPTLTSTGISQGDDPGPVQPVVVSSSIEPSSRQVIPVVVTDSSAGLVVEPEAVLPGVWRSVYFVPEQTVVDTVRVYIEEVKGIESVKTPVNSTSPVTASVVLPSGCTAELAEEAFLQLRARMAGAQNEDEMLLMVRSAVRNQCFSVSQARRLSNIFLYEESRYRFFDSIYGYVTDPEHFSDLGSFLTDPIYKKRFEALLQR